MELQVTPDRQFAVYRPPGWTVHAQGAAGERNVTALAPAGHALAQLSLRRRGAAERDAVQAAAAALQALSPRPQRVGRAAATIERASSMRATRTCVP